jgi:hypothetical protein
MYGTHGKPSTSVSLSSNTSAAEGGHPFCDVLYVALLACWPAGLLCHATAVPHTIAALSEQQYGTSPSPPRLQVPAPGVTLPTWQHCDICYYFCQKTWPRP